MQIKNASSSFMTPNFILYENIQLDKAYIGENYHGPSWILYV